MILIPSANPIRAALPDSNQQRDLDQFDGLCEPAKVMQILVASIL
jgi:hypothetical protein